MRTEITTHLISLLLLVSTSAQASTATQEPKLFDGFWQNTRDSFVSEKAWFHLAGVGATAGIIATGLDGQVHRAFRHEKGYVPWLPGVMAGGLAPVLLTVPIYFTGRNSDDPETLGAAYALAQATIISGSYVALLKALTGRPEPDIDSPLSPEEQSRVWRFGFLRGGVFHGWPSGHSTTVSTLMFTLTHYYPEKSWLRWTTYGAVTYMALTVSAFNYGQMHWFSEGVAGAFMGYAIGSTVGTNFRAHVDGLQAKEAPPVSVLPYFSSHGAGAQLIHLF